MPFDNPPKSPYLNLPSKSPVPLPPSTPFSTDHFVPYTCSENTRKSVRTASTPHTDFRLDPSFTSLPSQGRSAPPPSKANPGSASHTLGLAHGFCRLGRAFCAFLAASLLPFASGYEDTGLSPATRAAPRDPAALTGVPLSYPLPVEVRLPEGAAAPRCLPFFPSHLSLRFLRCGSSRSTQVTEASEAARVKGRSPVPSYSLGLLLEIPLPSRKVSPPLACQYSLLDFLLAVLRRLFWLFKCSHSSGLFLAISSQW